MNGCTYKTEDGRCEKYSGDGVVSWCVEGPCTDCRPSNGDKIRAMTDEELRDMWFFIHDHIIFCSTNSYQGLLDWLKQEVSE